MASPALVLDSTDVPVAALPPADSPNLDLLRACAVLCVFLAHLVDWITRTRWDITRHLGQAGVLMFFVHTSLVLMFSLERSAVRNGRARELIRDFYVRRAFRIYPLAIVCALICICFGFPPGFGKSVQDLTTIVANLTLTTNLFYVEDILPVMWSLPLEVQMYLFLPFLFLSLRGRSVSAAAICWLGALVLALIQPHVISRLNVISWAPCFVPGVIAWRFLSGRRAILDSRLWPVALVAFLALYIPLDRSYVFWYRWCFCLCLGFSIPLFAEMRPSRITQLIARYSYGIYLTHMPLMSLAFHCTEGPMWIRASLFTVSAVIAPIAMFHLVEKPSIDLGRRFLNSRSARQSTPEAAFPGLGEPLTVRRSSL